MSKNQRHGGKSGHDDHDGHDSGHHQKVHVLIGTRDDDPLTGTDGKDIIHGKKGDDHIDGGAGNDLLFGDKGNDQLFGGDGRDFLFGGKGNDLLDGGAGNDFLFGGKGDDFANYTLTENLGACDVYDGGKGFDTLQLTLTSAQMLLAEEEIAAFEAFLEDGGKVFRFESFGLTVRNFEALKIVTIGGNTAPVAVGDDYAAVEDQALVILVPGVLANDSDAESSPLTLTAMLVTGPTSGTLTLNDNGSFTYTPMADFFGEDSFTYEAFDGALNSNEATVTLQVAPVNDAPVAVDDTATVTEDSSGNVIDVLGNDSKGATNESGQILAVSAASASHGAVVINSDGTLSYTPNADYFGTDTINYTVTDNGTTNGLADPLTDSAQVAVTVTGVNDAPVAVDDTITETALDGRIHVAVVGKQNVPGELDGSSYVAAAGQLNPALFNATAIAHTATADWAQILQGFDVVVIGDDGIGADYTGSSIFSALFDFASAGGGVITTGWFATALNEYTNPLLPGVPDMDADKITPIASGAPSGKLAPATIDVVDQSHPITTGIISYQAEAAAHDLALALDNTPTATTLATWTSASGEVRQAIAVDEVGDGRTVFLGNLYMANDAFFSTAALRSGDADLIFERAVAWAAGAGGSTATSVTIDPALLLNNDTDVDTMHADLFLSSFTQPGADGATLSLVDGNLVYTLGAQGLLDLLAGQAATDSFDYTVSDGSGGFDTASVNLSITGLDTLL